MLLLTVIIFAVFCNVYLFRKNVNIGAIMLLNSLLVALYNRMPFSLMISTAFKAALSEKTLELIFILIAIMIIENIMRTSGMIVKMAQSLRVFIKNGLFSAIMLSAALGLLPSPGGARFSCPIVEEVTGDGLSNLNKAYINYWFRHVWLDGFILYPGVILAAKLINVPVGRLFFHLLIFIFVYAVSGILILGEKGEEKNKSIRVENNGRKKTALKDIAFSLSPVILMIGLYLLLVNRFEYALDISAVATIIYLIFLNRLNFKEFKRVIKESLNLNYVVLIIGVMVFKDFLTVSGAVESFSRTVIYYKIPKELLFILIPLISNFFFGVTVSFVSLAFPILIPLGLNQNLWHAACAFAAGFIGGMITPVHLCSVMSAEYFNVSIERLLKKVMVSSFAVIITIIIVLILSQ